MTFSVPVFYDGLLYEPRERFKTREIRLAVFPVHFVTIFRGRSCGGGGSGAQRNVDVARRRSPEKATPSRKLDREFMKGASERR